jgi:hypothetical protein
VIYSFYLAMDGQMLQPKKPMMALVVEQLSPGRSLLDSPTTPKSKCYWIRSRTFISNNLGKI